ncbi:MAG: hypothetical protein PVH68_19130, partial [Armatimonadota bacterium]
MAHIARFLAGAVKGVVLTCLLLAVAGCRPHGPDDAPLRILTRPAYAAEILPRGDTAWIWTWGGLLHLDRNGRLLRKYTTSEGLPSNTPPHYGRRLIAGHTDPGKPVYVATSRGLAAVLGESGRVVALGP